MDFRRVGGQLWIYADHKAEWALIPKYVVWFNERPLQHVDSPPKDKWQADSSQDKASQEHNLAESRAHLLQAKAVHTRAAREGNE